MTENLASLLCYAGGWITGLIFLFKDRRPGVRFHAAQSVITFAALNIVYLFLSASLSPGLILDVVILAIVGVWAFLMFKAFKGERFEIPVVASLVMPLTAFVDKHFGELMRVSAAGSSDEGPSVGPAPEPFDATKGSLVVQIVKQIGHWSEGDSIRALGGPSQQEKRENQGNLNTHFYREAMGQTQHIELSFDEQSILGPIVAYPLNLSMADVRRVLGEGSNRKEPVPGKLLSLEYPYMYVFFLPSDMVSHFVIYDPRGASYVEPFFRESFAAPVGSERAFAAAQGASGISQAGVSQGFTQAEPAAAPVPSRPPAPPAEPFDLKRGAVTSQLVKYIGYWTDADAARALGTPAEREALDAAQEQCSYSYQDPSGNKHVIQLIFNTRSKILTGVSVMPWRVFLSEMKPVLGNEAVARDIQGGWKSYDYSQRQIAAVVDQDEFVVRLVLYGSHAASLFASSAEWISRMP
jgi:uncharacterized membrane protein